jgi:nitrogen fixation/metabolism regulation signal transduction histidine kinase
MYLRTKIFHQLVLFALIPSVVVGLAAYYLLFESMDRASTWFSVSSPDRTINSLRIAEARLQDEAAAYLMRGGGRPDSAEFDWWLIMENDSITDAAIIGDYPGLADTMLSVVGTALEDGPVRAVVHGYLLLGAGTHQGPRRTAGGFILDRDYLDGFRTATAGLSESRRFHNIQPGLILFLIVAGGAVLVLIIAVAYMLSRRLSRTITTPLEQLTAATAAAAGGDYTGQISAGGTEEIVRLANTFNHMMDDLEESRRRLIDAERVAAWQDFARRMAHELKNPLTPISLSLYRIKKALQEAGQYQRFEESIEAISSQVSRLERLATDYAGFAKLPAPKMQSCDLAELARKLVSLYAPQLESYRFEANIPAQPLRLTGDPDHLHQVMVNLMKNAIEFAPSGGKIGLTVQGDLRRALFVISNECDRVDAETLRMAKMPYLSTREGGSGLGLAVSEKIVIDHGGSLTLAFENGMAVVRFEIPLQSREGGSS